MDHFKFKYLRTLIVLIVAIGWLQTKPLAAQEVDHIYIVSTLTGKASIRSDLMIAHEDDHYFADHFKYSSQTIHEFLREVLSPQSGRVTLHELGITRDWLDQNSAHALELARKAPQFSKTVEVAPSKADFDEDNFLKKFTDPAHVLKLLESYYRELLEGFYPEVKIVITLKGGEQIKARSTSRHLRMIPWHIEAGGSIWSTYNARITSALVGLLPGIFATNRDRLTGDLMPVITHRLLTSK